MFGKSIILGILVLFGGSRAFAQFQDCVTSTNSLALPPQSTQNAVREFALLHAQIKKTHAEDMAVSSMLEDISLKALSRLRIAFNRPNLTEEDVLQMAQGLQPKSEPPKEEKPEVKEEIKKPEVIVPKDAIPGLVASFRESPEDRYGTPHFSPQGEIIFTKNNSSFLVGSVKPEEKSISILSEFPISSDFEIPPFFFKDGSFRTLEINGVLREFKKGPNGKYQEVGRGEVPPSFRSQERYLVHHRKEYVRGNFEWSNEGILVTTWGSKVLLQDLVQGKPKLRLQDTGLHYPTKPVFTPEGYMILTDKTGRFQEYSLNPDSLKLHKHFEEAVDNRIPKSHFDFYIGGLTPPAVGPNGLLAFTAKLGPGIWIYKRDPTFDTFELVEVLKPEMGSASDTPKWNQEGRLAIPTGSQEIEIFDFDPTTGQVKGNKKLGLAGQYHSSLSLKPNVEWGPGKLLHIRSLSTENHVDWYGKVLYLPSDPGEQPTLNSSPLLEGLTSFSLGDGGIVAATGEDRGVVIYRFISPPPPPPPPQPKIITPARKPGFYEQWIKPWIPIGSGK